MAEGESSDCHIVPTADSNIFHLRVRLLSPEDGRAQCLSTSTVVAGSRCNASYWPAHTSTHVTFILNGPVLATAAKVSTRMVLLDKTGSPAPSIGTGRSADVFKGEYTKLGYVLRAGRDDVKANCVVDKDNYFDVLCTVDIDDGTPPASSLQEKILDLGHDLAIMADKQEHTDVSFSVGGESFSAHRLVLAARSPVFKAELYGPMAESKMTSITIEDMEATTFRSVLHYLYHGSLPNAGKAFTVPEYQHLLIAADRYGVERLKKNCEEKLVAESITIDSVVSMLELAEDHVCPKLKAMCLDFLADPDNFKIVAISAEYSRLMQSFPNLLVEVRNKMKIAQEESATMNPGAHKERVRYMDSNPFTMACLWLIILYLVVAGIFIFLF